MREQALAEIEGIARNPGFATRSGEPSEALEEIVKIIDAEKEAEQTSVVADLYGMVQEGKRLLLLWKRSSGLTAEAKRKLRDDTQAHLRNSSTAVVSRASS